MKHNLHQKRGIVIQQLSYFLDNYTFNINNVHL
jgi:hypothetical protein